MCVSKFATRILTAEIRVVCISKFATRIFTPKVRVVCSLKFATRIFTAKIRVRSFSLQRFKSKFKIRVVHFKIYNSDFFVLTRSYLLNGQVILFHWMGKLFHYALFESFAYNNAYYSTCDRVIINYLISTFCVERANEPWHLCHQPAVDPASTDRVCTFIWSCPSEVYSTYTGS